LKHKEQEVEMTIAQEPAQAVDKLLEEWQHKLGNGQPNISQPERAASLVGGGLLALYGLSRLSFGGLLMALLGGGIAYRGASGQCPVYKQMGINNAGIASNPHASVQGSRAIQVKKTVTINKSPEELYRFWLNFENLPSFMEHLESVTVSSEGRSHWVAKAPMGMTAEWDAEIINQKENQMIAWRSLPGSKIANAGSVQFKVAPGEQGTEVRVELDYEPPLGVVGAIFAKVFGEEPALQVQEDLRHFKHIMEAGEKPTTTGQPSGRAN